MSKTFPKEEKFVSNLRKCTARFEHNLKELRLKLRKWIVGWENEFFIQNLHEPVAKDFDALSSVANGKVRLTEKILRAWNIRF